MRENEIAIRCEVATRSATGVEMEALTGVTIAALTLYDMMKSADKTMRIEGITLVSKVKEMKVARLTISDRASAGVYADKSGPEIERVFCETWKEPCDMVARIIPDERENISRTLAFLADQERCNLISDDRRHRTCKNGTLRQRQPLMS